MQKEESRRRLKKNEKVEEESRQQIKKYKLEDESRQHVKPKVKSRREVRGKRQYQCAKYPWKLKIHNVHEEHQ